MAQHNIDLVMNKDNMYREEAFTDLQTGSIRQLTPVNADGTADTARSPRFVGHTQLMTPEGPLPLSCEIQADNLEDAIKQFPQEANKEVDRIVAEVQKRQQQQQGQGADQQAQRSSGGRIIVPGRE